MFNSIIYVRVDSIKQKGPESGGREVERQRESQDIVVK